MNEELAYSGDYMIYWNKAMGAYVVYRPYVKDGDEYRHVYMGYTLAEVGNIERELHNNYK